MKQQHMIIVAALVGMAGLFLLSKNKKAAAVKTANGAPAFNAPAALLSTLANTQITLSNGAVLDTENGAIFDPLIGNYTNVYTGTQIY